MKTHYAATKIIASSPENVKYSLGGIKETAGVEFKARGWWWGARHWECLAQTQAAFSSLPTLLLAITRKKIKQDNFVMSYLQKSANSL